jgi:hypothetical protein
MPVPWVVTPHYGFHRAPRNRTMPAPSAVLSEARRWKKKMGNGDTAPADDSVARVLDPSQDASPPTVPPAHQTRNKAKTSPDSETISLQKEIGARAAARGIRTILPAFSKRLRLSFAEFSADFAHYCAQHNVGYHVRTSLKQEPRNMYACTSISLLRALN